MCVCRLSCQARNAYAPLYVITRGPPPYFSTLSHKRHDFRKKKTENKMCVLSFCTLFVGNFSHYKKNSATFYHKLHMSSCKVSIFLVKFLWNLNLLAKFKKNTQIPSFTKISSGGVELFHADGQTDMTKLFTVLRTRLKTQFLSSSWNFLSI